MGKGRGVRVNGFGEDRMVILRGRGTVEEAERDERKEMDGIRGDGARRADTNVERGVKGEEMVEWNAMVLVERDREENIRHFFR